MPTACGMSGGNVNNMPPFDWGKFLAWVKEYIERALAEAALDAFTDSHYVPPVLAWDLNHLYGVLHDFSCDWRRTWDEFWMAWVRYHELVLPRKQQERGGGGGGGGHEYIPPDTPWYAAAVAAGGYIPVIDRGPEQKAVLISVGAAAALRHAGLTTPGIGPFAREIVSQMNQGVGSARANLSFVRQY